MLVASMLVVDYDIMAIAISRLLLFYIKTGFRFFAYKNHNVKKAVAVINVSIVGMLTIGIPAISILIIRVFLYNISLAIFAFSIAKIAIWGQ